MEINLFTVLEARTLRSKFWPIQFKGLFFAFRSSKLFVSSVFCFVLFFSEHIATSLYVQMVSCHRKTRMQFGSLVLELLHENQLNPTTGRQHGAELVLGTCGPCLG